MNVPEELLRNPHFARYYRTWQRNESSIVFVPLAQICREQGLLDQAREICERGLEKHPSSVSGRLMLARIYFDQDHMAEARSTVVRVLDEFPGQQEAMTLLARIRRSQGDVNEDEEITEVSSSPEAGGLEPAKSTSLWENVTMAKIYADQGETRVARQMLDRILAKNPNDERARALKEDLNP